MSEYARAGGEFSDGNEVVFKGVGEDWGTVTHFAIVTPKWELICSLDPLEVIHFWKAPPFPWVQYLLLFGAFLALVLWGISI